MREIELQLFLEKALSEPSRCWQRETIRDVGTLQVPERIFGEYPFLFRGDVHRLWADWFLGTCVDVDMLSNIGATYPIIYDQVRQYCTKQFGKKESVLTLAKSLARIADSEVARLKNIQRRKTLSFEDRQIMLDLANGEPRCWICGYKFIPEAVAIFRDGTVNDLPRPLLVDLFKPIGVFARDMQIEVDHVHPFSAGGGQKDNLRIACGWCNRFKSNNTSLYDVAGGDRAIISRNKYYSLPQPFWVVRLLALVGKSEISGYTSKDHELTVTLRNIHAKATPQNLMVCSYEDDIVPFDQIQSRDLFAQFLARQT